MSKYYSINEFSKILGVSAQTLRNWDKNGKLHPHHTSSNGYRYYSHEQLNQVTNIKPNFERIVIGYCRVSSNKQKDDLERQIENMKLYLTAQGRPFEIISDIGSGINYKKKGLKDLAICSDGNKYRNINKTQRVKKLREQKRRLQRSISRCYEKNKKGKEYCKTNNVIKKEQLLLKLNHRLTNIYRNYLHQTTSEIIKREPSFVCIEDLTVKGMMKNRHLSKEVQQQGFYEFRKQIEYKAERNNILVVIADRFFPSSKLCSCCGNIKKDLRLSDRIYKCKCGNVIDRDYQAALNLKRYGENAMKQSVE